jgi:N utilization substance protein A
MKGNRVQNIVQELRGEKIDIVQWSPDVARFVCNALSPAEISRVIIDEDNRSMEVIVNDEYLSIAIGKGGQNVSLACEITGWHLEVTSEEEYSREVKLGYESLMKLDNVGLPMAEILFKSGYASLMDIVETTSEELASVMGISLEEAEATIVQAKDRLMEEQAAADKDPSSGFDTEEQEEVEAPAEDEGPAEAEASSDAEGEAPEQETDGDVMDDDEMKT